MRHFSNFLPVKDRLGEVWLCSSNKLPTSDWYDVPVQRKNETWWVQRWWSSFSLETAVCCVFVSRLRLNDKLRSVGCFGFCGVVVLSGFCFWWQSETWWMLNLGWLFQIILLWTIYIYKNISTFSIQNTFSLSLTGNMIFVFQFGVNSYRTPKMVGHC